MQVDDLAGMRVGTDAGDPSLGHGHGAAIDFAGEHVDDPSVAQQQVGRCVAACHGQKLRGDGRSLHDTVDPRTTEYSMRLMTCFRYRAVERMSSMGATSFSIAGSRSAGDVIRLRSFN